MRSSKRRKIELNSRKVHALMVFNYQQISSSVGNASIPNQFIYTLGKELLTVGKLFFFKRKTLYNVQAQKNYDTLTLLFISKKKASLSSNEEEGRVRASILKIWPHAL